MKERIKKILTNIESVKEDLLALSDDIWLSIEHNDSQALQRGVEFKAAYNECMAVYTSDSDRLSALIQNFTDVAVDPDEDTVPVRDAITTNQDRERLIRELDPHIPHSLNEDFRYKRPLGFILEGEPYVPRNTWSQVYTSVCKHLAKKFPDLFDGLPDNPNFTSTQGNRYFTRSAQQLRVGKDVGMGVYAEFNLNANQLRDAIKDLLDYFKVSHDHFKAYLREDRDSQG
jgi:hypothetical protein